MQAVRENFFIGLKCAKITLQSEYYKEIFKVEIFQGRNTNSEKKISEFQSGFEDLFYYFMAPQELR